MDKFKEYTIEDLLKSLELLSRLSATSICLKHYSDSLKFDKQIEEHKAEILRRCSLG